MAATIIKSSDLDFQNIKESLKNYFKQQDEFADYDFDASGLNNVLDVLAYNTHLNGLTANFAINESFLPTAQLRASIVSHAETLGYEVRSITTSKAVINISVNMAGVVGRRPQIQLPAGWTFTSPIRAIIPKTTEEINSLSIKRTSPLKNKPKAMALMILDIPPSLLFLITIKTAI